MKTKTKLLTAVASVMVIAAISCTTAVGAASSQPWYDNTDVNFSLGKEGKFYIRDNDKARGIDLLDVSVSCGNYWSWFSNKTYAEAYARAVNNDCGVEIKQYATFKESKNGRGYTYNTNFSNIIVPCGSKNGYTQLCNNNVKGKAYESRIRIDCINKVQYNGRGKMYNKKVPIDTTVISIFS